MRAGGRQEFAWGVAPNRRLFLSEMISSVQLGKKGRVFTQVPPEVLTTISEQAIFQVNHFYRRSHLLMLHRILNDRAASDNDRYVAKELLNNAEVAAQGVLPSCQDTGTAVVLAKRGFHVLTDGTDEKDISLGIRDAYKKGNLRYSQVAPQTMFVEKNTKTNLPAQIDIMAVPGGGYKLLYIVKGGGSANKTQLFQKTKALLNDSSFEQFIVQELLKLGTAACPPYHLAVVVGGLGADQNLKTVKLASCKYYDTLPDTGSPNGRAFRDRGMENKILYLARNLGVGAQFGGKYFLHDVRVIRLPRHGASCPVGIGVSCSADRQMNIQIQSDGVFYEKLEHNPAQLWDLQTEQLQVQVAALDSVPGGSSEESTAPGPTMETVEINLDLPMKEQLSVLTNWSHHTFIVVDDKGNDFFQEFKSEDGRIPEEVNSSIYVVLEFFERLDSNNDQMVEAEELMEGFDNLTQQEADGLVAKYDLGHFGGLNLDEFLTMVMNEDHLKIDNESARAKLLSGE
eukprot:g14808.t1